MRKLLAIIFLTVFSFQVLPLKAIGKLLSSGQTTEEVQHGLDGEDGPGGKVAKFGDDIIYHHHTFDLFASRCGFNDQVSVFIHRAEALPSVHVAEMLSPPPDC